MSSTITRNKAKAIIARATIGSLSREDINEALAEYLRFSDPNDVRESIAMGELPQLSEETISVLVATDSPEQADVEALEPLIIDFLIFQLLYATNAYLEAKLADLGIDHHVEGQVEEAGVCPCCQHYAIDPGEAGLWDICPVCFWENGGDGPNHMQLAEAQANFKSLGAISESARAFVDPDGQAKYPKAQFEQS